MTSFRLLLAAGALIAAGLSGAQAAPLGAIAGAPRAAEPAPIVQAQWQQQPRMRQQRPMVRGPVAGGGPRFVAGPRPMGPRPGFGPGGQPVPRFAQGVRPGWNGVRPGPGPRWVAGPGPRPGWGPGPRPGWRGDRGWVAPAIVGSAIVGGIIAGAGSRGGYVEPYYESGPVYVAPQPRRRVVQVEEDCYIEQRRVWSQRRGRHVIQNVEVCH